ncbi:hypothetical protein R2Q81_05330 [Microbacterium aquimaris]|uniref:hypothetical protein n=1 Tax=Microbacterium aquimaris TaxID=459816 RepID=UPI002AD469DB|nr:hypothetical protein [Microbacterium aquimaris]MDZ8275374.1 hypothetical protein [Microbacterium aquimaris]
MIETTELLMRDLSAGEPSKIIWDDSVADLREPTDWAGLSAGEPEHFTGGYWIENSPLDPQWMINLEGLPMARRVEMPTPGTPSTETPIMGSV